MGPVLPGQLLSFTCSGVSPQHLEYVGDDEEGYEDEDRKQGADIVCLGTNIHCQGIIAQQDVE
ncbi:MAG TPA: hypothetical protein PL006_06225 [Deltaproteobacteria bacterium]|nr:hypothetical protein [Deltaproteobacteria bacterium]HQM72207.1 hypothetical protein [Deltaproteobacteria bacterium]